MPTRSFKIGSKVLDIPSEQVDSFLSDMPDAVEVKSFIVGNDTLDIPLNEVDSFLSEVKDAKPIGLKKKGLSENRRGIGSKEQSVAPEIYSDQNAPTPVVAEKQKNTEKYPSALSSTDLIGKTLSLVRDGWNPKNVQSINPNLPSDLNVGTSTYAKSYNIGGLAELTRGVAQIFDAIKGVSAFGTKAMTGQLSRDIAVDVLGLFYGKEFSNNLHQKYNELEASITPDILKKGGVLAPFGKEGSFAKDVEGLPWVSKQTTPNTIAGDISKGVARMIPDIALSMLAPEVKVGQLFSAVSPVAEGVVAQGVKNVSLAIPKFGVYLGAKEAGLSLDDSNKKGLSSTETVIGAANSASQGVVEGAFMHYLGVGGEELAKLSKAAVMGATADVAAKTVANGLLFGGSDALIQYATTGEVNKSQVAVSVGLGAGMSMVEMPMALKNDIYNKAYSSFFTSTDSFNERVANTNLNPANLRTGIKALDEKISTSEPSDVPALEASKNILVNTLGSKAVTEAIKADPSTHVEAILANDNMTADQKQVMLQKVDSVLKDSDVSRKMVAKIATNIERLGAQVEEISKISGTDASPMLANLHKLIEQENQKINSIKKGETPVYMVGDFTTTDKKEFEQVAVSSYEKGYTPRLDAVNDDVTLNSVVSKIPSLSDKNTLTNEQRKEILDKVEIKPEPTKVAGEKEDAVQVESAEEGVLRQEGPEVGLREMGEGNKGEEGIAREGEVKAEEKEVAPDVTETATVSDTVTEPVEEVSPAKPKSDRAMAMEVGDKYRAQISEGLSDIKRKASNANTVESYRKVKTDLLSFVKENRSRLSKVASRSIPVIVRKIAKATPRNIDNTISFVERILTNQELAEKVSSISDRISKIKLSGMGSYVSVAAGLKDLSIRSRATDKKISLFLNSIKLENVDSEELINDLDELTKGLSKKVPDISMVEPFMQKWQQSIDDALFQKLTHEPTTKENVEALTSRVSDTETMLSDIVDKLNKGDAVTIDEIKKLKYRIASLNAAVTSMMERGDVMVSEGQLEAVNTSLETLNKALLNDISSLSVDGLNAIKKAENEHKTMMLTQVNGKLVYGIKTADYMKDGKLSEILSDVKKMIVMAKGDQDFINRIGMADVDIVDAAIDQIVENEFVPTSLGVSYENIKRAFIEHRINTRLIGQEEVLIQLKKILNGGIVKPTVRTAIKIIGKPKPLERINEWANVDLTVDNIKKYITTTQNSNIDDLLNLVDQSAPFWTETTNDISTAINKSKAKAEHKLQPLKNMASKLVMGELGREGKPKSAANLWATYISSPSKVPDAARKPFIKAGIVLASQRFYNLVNSKPLIRKEANDRYLLIKPTGETVKDENDVPVVFSTPAEAVDYHHVNKATLYGDDVMDMFYLLNYGKNKDRAAEAKLMSDPVENKKDIALMQQCYNELTNNQSKRIVVSSDADVAKFLSGVPLDAYNTVRATYEDPEAQQMIVYAGAIEGVPVVIDGLNYYPMNVKSGDKITDQSDMLDEAFSRVEGKKSIPKALGNIYGKKANVIEYIDFDAFRATYRYMNQVTTSYYVVPQVRATLKALTNLKKQTNGDMSNFLAATQKDLVLGVQNEYNKARIYDVLGKTGGNIARGILKGTSMRLMSSPVRKYIDLNTQYIASMAYDGSWKPQVDRDRPKWDQFFSYDENMGDSGYDAFLDTALRYSMESGDKFVNKAVLEKISEDRLKASDDKNRRIFWVSKFLQEYKRQAGDDFNVDAYNSDDGIYRGQMNESESFRQAKAIANQTISQTMRPSNMFEDKKFLGKLVYGRESWGRQGWVTKWLMPMSAYSVTSSGTFAKESRNVFTGNNGGRAKAGKRFTGLVARDALYTIEFGIYSNLLALAVAGIRDGFDDDDESNTQELLKTIVDQYTLQGLTTNALGAILSLMLGGYANIGRSAAGFFVSYAPRKTIEAVKFSNPIEAKQWQDDFDAMVKVANLKQSMPMLDLRGDKINLDVLFGLAMPMVGGAIDNMYGTTADAVTNLAAVATGETEGNVHQKAVATSVMAINNALSLASVVYPGQNDLNKALKEYTKQITVKDGSIGANQFMDAISLAESIKDNYNKKALVDKEEANSFLRDKKAGDVTYGELMLYLDDNRSNVTLVQAVYRAATDEKAPFSMQERREMLKSVEAEAQNYVESLKGYKNYEPSEKVQDYFDGPVSDYFMAKEEKKAEAFDAVMDSIYKLLEQRRNKGQEN